MTVPPLPAQGSTNWYPWSQGVHQAATAGLAAKAPADHTHPATGLSAEQVAADIGDAETTIGAAARAALVPAVEESGKFAAAQPMPARITPFLTAQGWQIAASAYFGANWWIGSRFRVTSPTRITQAALNIVAAGGNIQIAVLALSGVNQAEFVRVLDTGIVPCPAAAQRAIIPFAQPATLQPGDYAVVFWADSTTVSVQHSLSNNLAGTGLSISAQATIAGGVPASGTANVLSGRTIHGITIEGAPWLDLPGAVLLGDSVTQNAGWWTLGNAYAGSPLGSSINVAVGGDTTAQMLARFDTDVATSSPDVVSVLGGTNDVGQNISAATTIANLTELYDRVVDLGATLVHYPIPPRTATSAQAAVLREINAWLRDTPRLGATFVDWSTALSLDGDEAVPNPSYFADEAGIYVHPNEAGRQRMAEVLAPKLAGIA